MAGLLPPLRQISLDVIQATVLGREKGLHRQPSERQNIFQDVFNEVRRRRSSLTGCITCYLPGSARHAALLVTAWVPAAGCTMLGLQRAVLSRWLYRPPKRLCPPPSCAVPRCARCSLCSLRLPA